MNCGGTTYRCTNAGGTWEWRPSAQTACDDGNACTYTDVCSGGTCQGTGITCTSTACADRSCNGTSSCTVVYKGSSTSCGTTACPGDSCSSSPLLFNDYPASCTRYCANGADTCNTCSCTAAQTTCAVGGGNQCCTATCAAGSGCGTAAGSCADVCGNNLLTTGRSCAGCGANLANGTCGGGTGSICDDTTHSLCQTVTCGGSTYRCTNTSGWQWRTSTACNDGNACTYNDACSGATCGGSSITCTSDYCTTRTCNGTSSCTVTPIDRCGDGTCNCGETDLSCVADCGAVCGVNVNETFDTGTLPSGWYLYDGDGYGHDWTWQTASPPLGGSGGYWQALSDFTPSRWVDDTLVTATYNRTNCAAVLLEFDHRYQDWNADDFAWVYISVDGGGWQEVVRYEATTEGHVALNLTGYLGPTSTFTVAFRYRGLYGWYWRLDNVKLSDTPGGAGWSGNLIAQTNTTQGNTSANICNIYWRRRVFVATYSAAEVSAAFGGMTSGTISKMRFSVTGQPTYQPLPSYAIGMKNTTNSPTTNNSGSAGGTFTTVKSQASESFTTGAVKTFDFTTPFAWNGQNLAISWAWGQCPTGYSSTGENPIGAGTSYHAYSDETGTYLVTESAGTSASYRPVIQLYGAP
jgi:hypothetical protein